MTKEKKNIDELLTEIDVAAKKIDWDAVLKLSYEVLEIEPEYKPAKIFLELAKAQLKNARPDSAEELQKSLNAIDLKELGVAAYEKGRKTLDFISDDVFVGRQKERERLKAAMEKMLSGQGRMVMLVGEPGIGKTRTSEVFRTYADLRGAKVLWGRCHEAGGMPPYWPWIQAIRSYVKECSAQRLSSEMGSGGGVIAELISDVGEKLPDLSKPVALDNDESSRFRLFDAMTTFLKSVSEAQPLVIVLDDLHWADTPTLKFLEFVAHELSNSRLLVVGTYWTSPDFVDR